MMKKQDNFTAVHNQAPTNGRRHAIVIGGSMAGLLAGRVLADHFDHVTIIERDAYPDQPGYRKGVPQSHHLHALLARGLQIIEQLFPGIRKELEANGAPVVETGNDLAWLTPAGWGLRFRAGLNILAFSRPLLDWTVRRRLTAFSRVRFLAECEVLRLLPDKQGMGVSGVAVRFRNRSAGTTEAANETNNEQLIAADLVVDASGRGSHAPEWLAALGYTPPRETVVNAFIGYASRLFERPAGFTAEWKAIFLQAAPPERTRAGIMFPVEGNRWMLTLCGGDRDYPPTDEAGFLDFAGSLPSPLLADAIKEAKPLSPIRSYRATENRMRHYDEMRRSPERFILLGDSVCAFNPVYGQGMTIAAMGALELDHCLRQLQRRQLHHSLDRFAHRFQKRLARVNALPWTLATSEDCRYRGTMGTSPNWKTRLMHRYMDQVIALTTENAVVRKVWLEVFQMLKPPAMLFHPSVILRLLRQGDSTRKHRRKVLGLQFQAFGKGQEPECRL